MSVGRANLMIVGGVILLVIIGAAAWVLLRTQVAGGADSPGAVVEELTAAISAEDPIEAMRLIHPEEGQEAAELFASTVERFQAAGVFSEDPLSGIDLEITDLDVDVRELHDDVAQVRIRGGDIDVSYRLDELDPGVRLALDGTALEDGEASAEIPDEFTAWDPLNSQEVELDVFVMVVHHQGRWFLSPTYTAAQYMTEWMDLADPEFDEEMPDVTGGPVSESPEAALIELVESSVDLDLDVFLEGITTDLPVFAAYADAFEELLGLARIGAPELAGVDVDIDNLEVTQEQMDDGRTKIIVENVEGDVTVDGERATFEFDGECAEIDYGDGDTSSSCLSDSAAARGVAPERYFVVMAEQAGGWRLDPFATLIEYGRVFLQRPDPAAVLRSLQLEHLMPTDTALQSEGTTTVEVGSGGVGVATFEGEADSYLSLGLTDAEEHRLRLVSPTGRPMGYTMIGAPNDCSSCLYELPEDGTYRLAVLREDWGTGSVEIHAHTVDPQELSAPDEHDVEISAHQVGLFLIDPPTAGSMKIELAAGEDSVVPMTRLRQPEGGISPCQGPPGGPSGVRRELTSSCDEPVMVVIPGRGGFRGTLHVEQVQFGFLSTGTFQVSGTVSSGGEATYRAYLPGNSSGRVVLRPDPDFDAVLEITTADGEGDRWDSGFEGDVERGTFSTGQQDGTWVLTVSGYSGDAGSFSLSIELDGS